MSSQTISWFHCGRCGALFQAAPGDLEKRLCPECGLDPSIGAVEAAADSALPSRTRKTESRAASEASEPRGKRTVRKRRDRFLMLKLGCVWFTVLALIVFVARRKWRGSVFSEGPVLAETKIVIPDEDKVFYDEAWKDCSGTLPGFLSAGTMEERSHFVLAPFRTESKMTRFHELNPVVDIDPDTLTLGDHAIVTTPSGKQIETLWNTRDGRRIEAVFRKEDDEWRLDWEHFTRYSDYPWYLFLSGLGVEEGDFRLLARERLADERKEAETLSVVFYAPRFGSPGDTGYQSPEFLVSRNSRDGRLLDAAFKLARRNMKVFGSGLPNLDPEGMVRVRVRIRRIEKNMERKFEIVRVHACHWYSLDDPGPAPAPEPTPAGAAGKEN